MMDVIGKGRWLAASSAVLVVASIVLLFTPGLKLGIDFTSGTSITYRFVGEDPGPVELRDALGDAGHAGAIIQSLGEGEYLIRTSDLGVDGKVAVDAAVQARTGQEPVTIDVTTVGKSVAANTVRNAITAVLVATVFVMIYLMYAFRTVPHSYRYGIAAVVALGHDVAITLGVFALLGRLIDAEVNAIFIVGILTVIGYSVNDTIVVFDRIRENVRFTPGRSLRQTANISIAETMMRSLGTSITTLIGIMAMLLFGGATLRDFMIVLLSGILVGTYSSIFIASPVLVFWESGAYRRFLPWRRKSAAAATP